MLSFNVYVSVKNIYFYCQWPDPGGSIREVAALHLLDLERLSRCAIRSKPFIHVGIYWDRYVFMLQNINDTFDNEKTLYAL